MMSQRDNDRRDFMRQATCAGAVIATVGATTAVAGGVKPERVAVPARPGAPFSRAVGFGGIIHVAGVVGRKAGEQNVGGGSFEVECRQAMENLKASVEAAGSTMDKVMKCGCFLTDVGDFPTMNKLFREYFPSNPPARSTVIVKELVVPNARLEIDCVTCA